MNSDLLTRRDRTMDRHDRVLDQWWPDKSSPEYKSELKEIINQFNAIKEDAEFSELQPVEQIRTLRWLGDTYADLAKDQSVATGEDLGLLTEAIDAYRQAETLLANQDEPLEMAKLNFNFANTLRRIDSENITLLERAEERYRNARETFESLQPGLLPMVQEALDSVRVLIKLAPLKNKIEEKSAQVQKLGDLIDKGEPTEELKQLYESILEEGGPQQMLSKVIEFVGNLPESVRAKDTDGKLKSALSHAIILASKPALETVTSQDAEIFRLLKNRIQKELDESVIDETRAETLFSALNKMKSITGDNDDDINSLISTTRELREGAQDFITVMKKLSHDLERPPEGTRSAEILDLWWLVRKSLLADLSEGGQAPKERSVLYDLVKRSTEMEKRIIKSGDDREKTLSLEQEAVRPLLHEIRRFTFRNRVCLASPVWSSVMRPTDPNTVFFSGQNKQLEQLSKLCDDLGLELLSLPAGSDFADRRWEQLTQSHIGIFDFTVSHKPALAQVAYELGIAQALGKPVFVLADDKKSLPFDIDVPVVPWSGPEDLNQVEQIIDTVMYWLPKRMKEVSLEPLIEEALSRYTQSDKNVYTTQTLKQIEGQADKPDPVVLRNQLETLISFEGSRSRTLIQTTWPASYPDSQYRRLFHVMPFGPTWATSAYKCVQKVCNDKNRASYIRGDKVIEPKIIHSIWDEICRATHVLVDITGFNPNVAFELGISHTLGRETLIVCQEQFLDDLFPMIEKIRVTPYRIEKLEDDLTSIVEKWLE